MFPGIGLVEKLVIFGLDIFIKNRAKKEKLRQNFEAFFKRSSKDTEKSAQLHKEHDRMRDEPWKKD